jgi:hypothetical protein
LNPGKPFDCAVDETFAGKYHGYARDRLYRWCESRFYRGLDASAGAQARSDRSQAGAMTP